MKQKLTCAILAMAAAGCSLPALSQEGEPIETAPSLLSTSLGVDITTAYFFRGYRQEDDGFISQPWFEVGAVLIEPGEEGDFQLDLVAGTWNSFHSEQTGALGGSVDSWYENDVYAGLNLTTGQLSFGLGYTIYQYPNSTFNTVHEVGLTASYTPQDETVAAILGSPSVGIYFEVDNSNVNDDPASFVQLAAGPTHALDESGDTNISVPVELGLSLSDYYEGDSDETFGYLSVGAGFDHTVHLERAGDLTFTAGVTLLFLGDTTEAVNNGDDVEVVASIGVSLAY